MIFDFIALIVRKILGIEIEKRTDLISFIALLLSILTAAGSTFYLTYAFFKGAKVDIYPDDQVLITKEDCGRGDRDMCLRLGATVAFSNSGEMGIILLSWQKDCVALVWQVGQYTPPERRR